jgi:ABC-type phosphate transport system substrate-binding protein
MWTRAAILATLMFMRLAAADPVATKSSKRRLVVIVSPTSAMTNISTGDLRRSYLGSITRWPNGQRITLVVLRAEAEAQRTFLKRVVQMTDIDYSQHWLGEVFRGRASGPPHVAASAAEAVRFVAGHPNAIGFVSMEAVDASVSLLSVDGKSAEAEDYPLAW